MSAKEGGRRSERASMVVSSPSSDLQLKPVSITNALYVYPNAAPPRHGNQVYMKSFRLNTASAPASLDFILSDKSSRTDASSVLAEGHSYFAPPDLLFLFALNNPYHTPSIGHRAFLQCPVSPFCTLWNSLLRGGMVSRTS